MTTRALIVGGGIAGPVLAMFLERIGIEAIVCEARREGDRDGGAFLGVAPNGMNVLAELGVADAVEAIASPCERLELRNARDAVIGAIDRSADGSRFGARLQMVRRAELHRALIGAAIERGVEVRFGRELVDLDLDDPASVTARFADGSEERADLLLGCDGIRSRTRTIALPGAPAPADSGLVDHAGFVRLPGTQLAPGVHVMVFGRRAFFGAFATAAGEIWWFHNDGQPAPRERARDEHAIRARILAAHEGDPSWIGELVAATPRLLGPYPLHDILTLPRWHRGRVCLVGDAAHATTPSAGQGASMALEDTIVLAKCLRDHRDHERAFPAFEQARRARVERIVRASRRTGSTKAPSSPIAAWIRDLVLPLFLKLGARGQDEAYAHRIAWLGEEAA